MSTFNQQKSSVLQPPQPAPAVELKPIQAQVLKALAEGKSISEAARECGVHRTTIHLWCRTIPEFSSALKVARRRVTEHVLDEIHSLGELAAQTIRDTMTSTDAPHSARLRAAAMILQALAAYKPTFPAGLADEIAMTNLLNEVHNEQYIQAVAKAKAAA